MLLRVLSLLLLLAAPALADGDASVRVRLFDTERPSQVTVRPERAPVDLLVDGRLVTTISPGHSVQVERSGQTVIARVLSVVESGRMIEIQPREGGHLTVTAGRTTRPYRGQIELRAHENSLAIINVVPLDDYIASVIPSEYPFPEIEGVKAQAVLVRTYALKSRGRFGAYDVVDHVGSQVYRGKESETPLAREAVRLTTGEVLTHNGELIEAVYFSSSGGHTADNESIWDGNPHPYLRGLPDPYDSESPLYRWTERVDRGRLLQALSRHYGFQVTGISIAGSSREGRVTRVRLHGSRERIEQANRFRLDANRAMGRQVFKSTFFELERRGDQYVINGRGFGHGVGMSQYGAREQARRGHTYREILYFYFTDVRLERRYDSGEPELLIADVPEAEHIESRPIVRPVATEETESRTRRSGW